MLLHNFTNNYEGVERSVDVYKEQDHFELQMSHDGIMVGTRIIKDHSESYAEDAAENYVFGMYELNEREKITI